MWAIVGTDRIADFARQRSVVAVFLATGYDQEEIDWVFRAWQQFNRDFESRWHLLIPSNSEIDGARERVCAENFNVELASELARMYGVERDDLPSLVFDNFNDEEKQIVISLRGKNEAERREFLEMCRDTILKHRKGERSPYRYRRDVAADIRVKEKIRQSRPLVGYLTRYAGSVIRFISAPS